jgi:serine/threonine protein kinase
MLEQVIVSRYKLKEKLNIGAFYDVYKAINIHNEIEVAIKL